jgi:hypothetical protein
VPLFLCKALFVLSSATEATVWLFVVDPSVLQLLRTDNIGSLAWQRQRGSEEKVNWTAGLICFFEFSRERPCTICVSDSHVSWQW